MMKRSRDFDFDSSDDITAMANYLMLLSGASVTTATSVVDDRLFTCKTCNRQFSSFQALGGHRASHKKPRLNSGELAGAPASPPKPKTHECSICGLEFPMGQALGGHMRRHRAAAGGERKQLETTALSLSPPVVKKTASNSRRVLCVDLNLTPMENTFVLGKTNPVAPVDCFF